MEMSDTAMQTGQQSFYRIVAFGAVAHALLVMILWAVAIYADEILVPGGVWLIGAWAWLGWPIFLAVVRDRASRLTAAAVVIGAFILAPAVPTIDTFSAWSLGGFAP